MPDICASQAICKWVIILVPKRYTLLVHLVYNTDIQLMLQLIATSPATSSNVGLTVNGGDAIPIVNAATAITQLRDAFDGTSQSTLESPIEATPTAVETLNPQSLLLHSLFSLRLMQKVLRMPALLSRYVA